MKNTKITERLNIQFSAFFFNVFNHANFGVPDPFVDDAGIGFADPTKNSNLTRQIQFGVKIIF